MTTTYSKSAHKEAINNQIASIKGKLISAVPVIINGVILTAQEASQKIQDLNAEYFTLVTTK